MRFVPLLVLLAGCAADPMVSPEDMTLSADLAPRGCELIASGAVTATEKCNLPASLCHPTGGTYESISVVATTMHALFEVNGVFALRSYARADFKAFDATVQSGGKSYSSNNAVAASTASLTVIDLTSPVTSPCDGIPHGSASLTLVEEVGGSPTGPGRVTLVVNF